MKLLKVEDYMSSADLKLDPEDTLSHAVGELIKFKKMAAPVVDKKGKLIGFLSEQDCLKATISSSYYCESTDLVKDLMRADVLSIKKNDSILETAQTMVKGNKPKIYPVIGEDNTLVGIITRTDVLKALDENLKSCFTKES